MKQKVKVSLILNSINIVLITIATIFMVLDFKPMGNVATLTAPGINAFQFFTVDSNLLLLAASVLYLVFEVLVIRNKRKDIPKFVYIIKYVATVSTTLTFLMVIFVLCPMVGKDFWMLFMNNNLAFHLICPLIGLVALLFFETFSPFKFKECLWGMIPMGVYSIYYLATVLAHFDGGPVPYEYDWYGFAQGGVPSMILYASITYVMTFFISVLVWLPTYLKTKNT